MRLVVADTSPIRYLVQMVRLISCRACSKRSLHVVLFQQHVEKFLPVLNQNACATWTRAYCRDRMNGK